VAESTLHVAPLEIVEVALTQGGEKSGPVYNRIFSIRIREKQIR
jgi:hypothetical protein